MDYKKILLLLLISMLLMTFALFMGGQIYDYSKEGLEVTKKFFDSLNNRNYNRAKRYVSHYLKPRIEEMRNVFGAYEADVKYNGLEYKVMDSNNNGVVIRAYYTLILQSKFNNTSQDVIMELGLKPVKGEGLKIVTLKQIK